MHIDLTKAKPMDQLKLRDGRVVFYIGPDRSVNYRRWLSTPGEKLYRSYMADGRYADSVVNSGHPYYSTYCNAWDVVENLSAKWCAQEAKHGA